MRKTSLLATLSGLGLLLSAGISGCASEAASGPESGPQSAQSGDAQSGESQSEPENADQPEVDRDPKGQLPTITLPTEKEGPSMKPVSEDPPKVITVKTLTKGEGAEVGPDDFIKVNYAGYLWDGEQFDSSYTSSGVGAPISFSLNQVIKGWKWGLANTHVGDQVMLIVPSEYGYGAQGTGNIPGGATLVFFVEIQDAVSVSREALEDAEPTDVELPEGIEIEGAPGEEPEVTFAKGTDEPEKADTLVLAKGTGSVITDEDAVEYLMTAGYWGSTERSYTWDEGISVVEPGSVLSGERVGSRVLLITPADEQGNRATFILVDILAAHPPR